MLARKGVATCDLDDMVATVILGAVSSLHRYAPDPSEPPDEALRKWIAGIARNVASHYREGRWFKRPGAASLEALRVHLPSATDPERAHAAREELERVLAWLAEQPELDREAFLAHDVEGQPLREIRAKLGSSSAALSRRIQRVRAGLVEARKTQGHVVRRKLPAAERRKRIRAGLLSAQGALERAMRGVGGALEALAAGPP